MWMRSELYDVCVLKVSVPDLMAYHVMFSLLEYAAERPRFLKSRRYHTLIRATRDVNRLG